VGNPSGVSDRAEGTQVAVVRPDHTVHLQKIVVGRDLGAQLEVLGGIQSTEPGTCRRSKAASKCRVRVIVLALDLNSHRILPQISRQVQGPVSAKKISFRAAAILTSG
jgi:hypothetical protein